MPKKKKTPKEKKDVDFGSQNLRILPLVEDELVQKYQLKKPLNPVLPDIKKGALVGIVASIRSGKTVLINNLMMRPEFFKDCFDLSVFISPTIFADKSMKYIRELYKSTCYDQYSDDIIYKTCAYQEGLSDGTAIPESYSIVCDDAIDLPRNSALIYLASRFRHYSQKAALVLFSTQKFRSLSPIVRTNATDWLISGVKNRKERESVIEEFGDAFGMAEDEFESMWNYATREPFSFLYVKMDKTPPEAYRNFEEQLYPSQRWKGSKSDDDGGEETEVEKDEINDKEEH